jgi:hypothetical protein
MLGFEPHHEYLGVKPLLDFFRGRTLEKQLDRFPKIARRLLAVLP